MQLLERFYFSEWPIPYELRCLLLNAIKNSNTTDTLANQICSQPPSRVTHVKYYILMYSLWRKECIYLSCIDKFTKFAKLFPLESKSAIHLRERLLEAIHYFTVPRVIVSDNEKGLLCLTVLNYLRALQIELYYTPT